MKLHIRQDKMVPRLIKALRKCMAILVKKPEGHDWVITITDDGDVIIICSQCHEVYEGSYE